MSNSNNVTKDSKKKMYKFKKRKSSNASQIKVGPIMSNIFTDKIQLNPNLQQKRLRFLLKYQQLKIIFEDIIFFALSSIKEIRAPSKLITSRII